MILQPSNLEDLKKTLADAISRGEKVDGIKLSAFHRVLEYAPEDMTVTVETGITLAALQAELAKRGQWLPIDPSRPEHLAIGALLANNESGPRRFGYGTIREHLIGIKVMLADGRVVAGGGKVVKNVAGYDLCKLFIGSRGALGVIIEATFKLRPLPESEKFVQMECESAEKSGSFLDAVFESDLAPVVLDLHNLSHPNSQHSALSTQHSTTITMVIGFAGAREDVEWQLARAGELGANQPSSLDHDARFWADKNAGSLRKLSVAPSGVAGAVALLGNAPFVARAGNGVIWHRGGPESPKADLPLNLIRRVKDAFDPMRVFNTFETSRE